MFSQKEIKLMRAKIDWCNSIGEKAGTVIGLLLTKAFKHCALFFMLLFCGAMALFIAFCSSLCKQKQRFV